MQGRRTIVMCRSIKTLRRKELPATEEECAAAALQYVRKISGYRKPSKANAAAFEEAVRKITVVTRELLEGLEEGKVG
jgi:hypothetical protein